MYNPSLDKRNNPNAAPAGGDSAAGELWGRRLSDEGRREFDQYAALSDAVGAA